MQLDMLVIAGSCSCTYAAQRFKYTSTLLTFHTVRRTVKELEAFRLFEKYHTQ